MGLHQIDRIAAYVRFLQENPQETELLFKELLIGVTSFFRDPAAWEQLKKEVIPALLKRRPAGGALRAWTPGCSTGEEAYSLAIVFKEALEQVKPAGNVSLQIFATDLDKDAIDKARAGVYPANITADVSPERLRRFFIQEERGYRVGKEIREMVVFAPQNVIMDPPFTKLDILVCRNLLIYLTPELQKKLIPLFHYSLNPGGVLFLGSAETIGAFTDLFAPVDVKARIYRRLDTALGAKPIEFPSAFVAMTPEEPAPAKAQRPAVNLQTLADQLILTRYAPAAVLTSDKGDILYISGRTGKYLEPAAGKANWNIFAMAREGLRYELGGAFQKALRARDAVTLKGLRVRTNGDEQAVDITVQPLAEPEELKGMVMIVFADAAAPPEAKAPRASGRTAVRSERLVQAGAGAPERPGGAADHPRRDADLPGGAQIGQRGAAVHQRGAPEHQRGADHLQGGDAVDERRAPDGQPRAAGQGERSLPGQQRHEEPPGQHRHRHPVSGRQPQRAPLYQPDVQDHQADPRRRGPADHRHRLRAGLSGAGRGCAGGDADAGLQGSHGRRLRRALVSGADHALPHPGEPDRRRGDHLYGRHRLQDAGDGAAQDAGRTGTARHRQDTGTGQGRAKIFGRKSAGATEREKGLDGMGACDTERQHHEKEQEHAQTDGHTDLRRRAEDKLVEKGKGRGGAAGDRKTAVETRRLVQELQIHQIELEMQNEELKQARDEAEAERERYLDLYDFAPVGYFTLDPDGVIRQVNLTGARLLGLERSRLLNRRFCHFVSEADVAAFNAFLKRVFEKPGQGELHHFPGQSGAATLPCPDRGGRHPGMGGNAERWCWT